MAISLKKLCSKSERKYNIKLLAGENGIENSVRWVHMVEDVEVPAFLHGNELIFTTGIARHEDDWLLSFVQNLIDKNSAGLIVNVGPYIKNVPQKVIEFCDENDFPLFSAPWETRLIDVTYEFCRIIIGDEKLEQSITEAFKNLIINSDNKSECATTLKKYGFREVSNYNIISVKFSCGEDFADMKTLNDIQLSFLKLTKLNNLSRGAFFWNKYLILIYQNITEKDIETLMKLMRKYEDRHHGIKAQIGISESVPGYDSLGELYLQSKSALTIAQMQGCERIDYHELGIYKILFNVKKRETLVEYRQSVLGALLSYDSKNNTDYCETLRGYLECNGSIKELSLNTRIHRNTLNYKIKKAKEIMGCDLTCAYQTEIMIAFTISDIIDNRRTNHGQKNS